MLELLLFCFSLCGLSLAIMFLFAFSLYTLSLAIVPSSALIFVFGLAGRVASAAPCYS